MPLRVRVPVHLLSVTQAGLATHLSQLEPKKNHLVLALALVLVFI